MSLLEKAGIKIKRDRSVAHPDLTALDQHMLPTKWRLHLVRPQKDPAMCEHEVCNMNGGCDECGDPSL